MNSAERCKDDTSPHARMRTFLSLRVKLPTTHPMHQHWLKMFERFSVCLCKIIPSSSEPVVVCTTVSSLRGLWVLSEKSRLSIGKASVCWDNRCFGSKTRIVGVGPHFTLNIGYSVERSSVTCQASLLRLRFPNTTMSATLRHRCFFFAEL